MKLSPHVLSHLPYLAALAEAASFTGAASQMNITQAAMSYQIKSLEEKLNCTLVVRQSGSRLRLTAAGEQLTQEYLFCAKRLEMLLQQMNHEAGLGTLRISTPVDFGSLLMPKIIARIKNIAPRLNIELHTSDEVVDLSSSLWDMAIRSVALSDEKLLYSSKICLVCSDKYQIRYGAPKSIPDIKNHIVLLRKNSNHRTWSELLKAHSLNVDHFEETMTLGNTIALKEAAKEGLGIALLPEFVVLEDIVDKKLDVLLPVHTKNMQANFYLSKIQTPQTQSYEKLLFEACNSLAETG